MWIRPRLYIQIAPTQLRLRHVQNGLTWAQVPEVATTTVAGKTRVLAVGETAQQVLLWTGAVLSDAQLLSGDIIDQAA